MGKNTGVDAEDEFETYWQQRGKSFWCYRVEDYKELYGRNQGPVKTRAKPSDYIVVSGPQTFFAEVKSTSKNRLQFSALRVTQHGFAKLITRAGGTYFVFIKNMSNGDWFRVPYEVIEQWAAEGKKSATWDDLGIFEWNAIHQK